MKKIESLTNLGHIFMIINSNPGGFLLKKLIVIKMKIF